MVLCHVYAPAFVIALKKQEGWDGWLGLGMMNTQNNEKELQQHEKENTTS